MQDWQPQGSHYYQIDGDTVRWRFHGVITVSDIDRMFEIWGRLSQEYGACFTVLDIREDVTVPAASRHHIGRRNRTVSPNGSTAIVGAGLVIRTIIQLMNNASRLLGRNLPAAYFCATLEEAESWLIREHKRRRPNSEPAG